MLYHRGAGDDVTADAALVDTYAGLPWIKCVLPPSFMNPIPVLNALFRQVAVDYAGKELPTVTLSGSILDVGYKVNRKYVPFTVLIHPV